MIPPCPRCRRDAPRCARCDLEFVWPSPSPEALEEAHRYGLVYFPSILLVWIGNALVSVIRGTGNMHVPSATMLVVAKAQIALGASLGLGWGPFPRMGMTGVALGQTIAFAGSCIWLAAYMFNPAQRIRLSFDGWQLQRGRFREILRVGLLAMLSPLQMVLTVLVMTALIARLGVDALAGYGIGARLEFLAIPVAFGSGDVARARRVAWVGGALSAAIVGVIGLFLALWPNLWSTMFTSKPEVIHYAGLYLRAAGPMFAFFGLGLTLYFASQGAGKVLGPVLAGTLRLAIIAIGGWVLVASNAPEGAYFALVAAGMAAHGLATAAVKFTRWGK